MWAITRDEIVVIDRLGFDPRSHLFAHADREELITNLYADRNLEIADPSGDVHCYPANKVSGLHFQHATNYSNARAMLLQDNIDRLYLDDPDDPTHVWPIKTGALSDSATLRALAGRLIAGTLVASAVLEPRRASADIAQLEHVATWHQTPGRVEIIRNGEGQLVAGAAAGRFIGHEDLSAPRDI